MQREAEFTGWWKCIFSFSWEFWTLFGESFTLNSHRWVCLAALLNRHICYFSSFAYQTATQDICSTPAVDYSAFWRIILLLGITEYTKRRIYLLCILAKYRKTSGREKPGIKPACDWWPVSQYRHPQCLFLIFPLYLPSHALAPEMYLHGKAIKQLETGRGTESSAVLGVTTWLKNWGGENIEFNREKMRGQKKEVEGFLLVITND